MNQAQKPIWHGIILVAGGAVGAGMFALPVVSAGAWTLWSFLGLVLIWGLTFLAARLLLFSNLTVLDQLTDQQNRGVHGPPISFNTLVLCRLGPKWAALNNLSLVFIMMILMYAYTSAGASIIATSLQQVGVDSIYLDRRWLSVGFATIIGVIICVGTTAVARISSFLMVIMSISFVAVALELAPIIKIDNLLNQNVTGAGYVWIALPVFVTAFACAGLVPSLVKHYRADREAVLSCLFWGTLIALLVYMIWLALSFGVLGRSGFANVIAAGGNTGELVLALSKATGTDVLLDGRLLTNENASKTGQLSQRLAWFSHCAIITSFLSVALGLFHFVQDKMLWGNHVQQRTKAALVCFLPPMFASFLYPQGFVLAIGYAGLLVAFSFFAIPALMVLLANRDARKRNVTAVLILLTGIVIGILKLLSVFNYLPNWP